MTERPQNVRSSRILERGYPNSGHHTRRPMPARNEDNQVANRSYNGNHRLDGTDEQSAAQQRDSRMGRW